VFLYWLSLGLLLVAAGLLALGFQKTIGDPMNWLGKGAQYVGGIYFLIGIGVTLRESIATRSVFNKLASTITPASAQSYRILVDTATEAIIAINAEGRIALLNSSAEKMFGYKAGEAVGSFLEELIVPHWDSEAIRQWINGAETGSSVTNRELTLRRSDGRGFPWRSLSPLECYTSGS
jgi:PAS domain S-box-containing protein